MILPEIGSLIFFMLIAFTALQTQPIIPDPCELVDDKSKIVDMCKTGNATESNFIGSTTVNSVILRMREQRDNCKCQAKLINQNDTYTVYMRKHNNLKSAAPENENCGLAIEIEFPYVADSKHRDLIQCTNGTSYRSIILVQDGVLELKSRIIEGTFTRGYCMQIFRDFKAAEFPLLRLTCQSDPTTTITPTSLLTTTSGIFSTTIELTTTQTKVIQESTSHIPKITTPSANATHKNEPIDSQVKDSTVYYIAGACGGGGLVIIIAIVIVIFCKRRNNTRRTKQPYQNAEENHQYDGNEYGYDGLKDNILYVSSDQNPNLNCSNTDANYKGVDPNGRHPNHHLELEDQTYSTIDNDDNAGKVEPAIKGKSIMADSNMMFGFEDCKQSPSRTPNDTNSEYAVVKKTNKKRSGSKTDQKSIKSNLCS